MKILHLTHTDINTDSRILKEIKVLAGEEGFFIYGLGVLSKNKSEKKVLNLENVKIQSIKLLSKKLYFLPRLFRHPLVFIELLLKVIYKISKLDIDIVHCHDTLVLPIGSLVKKLKGTKLIYDAHELESNKNGQNKFMSLGTLIIEKKLWTSIDLLISVSESIISWYNKELGSKKSILVLNSPEIKKKLNNNSKIKYNEKYFHSKFNIPADSFVFLYLGLLSKGRGIDKILEAFNSIEIKSHVVFVGYGEMEKKILELTKLNNKIHFHYPVDHDRVVQLSQNADFGLCLIENISLSDFYCLPNKLFEYSFSGLPILASDFPELSKIIRKFNLGICCNPELNEIISAIKKIEKSQKKFINSDLAELSWENQAKSLLNGYRELIF